MKKTNAKKEKIKRHTNNGITLIALVITIIVLLILAGVSIVMLTGENGVLTKATQSKEQTEIAQEKEEITLAYSAAKTNKGDKVSEDITVDELNAELDKLNSTGEASSGSGTLTVTFENGHKYTIDQGTGAITGPETGEVPDEGEKVEGVTIPKGFYYVGGTKEEGIVISDNSADKGKGTSHEVAKTLVGNQFVWVPVKEDSAFKRYEGYYERRTQSLLRYKEPYSKGYATEQTEYDAMKQSVLEHDGFYVARYEAGTENGERTSADKNNIDDEVVFKQGKNVYNYIGWSNSEDMTVQTGGAVEKAKGMYTDKEKYGVTSTLIYGIQWDAIMAWIDPAYTTGSCDTMSSFVADSTGKGYYYQSSPTTTGSDANYAVKNIYDLAGNVKEWTMEASDGPGRVSRGGHCSDGDYRYPASYRDYGYTPSDSHDYNGFRSALYL